MLEKIAFIYKESDNQQNLFTPYHTRFECAIKYGTDCTPYVFDYQCNTDHVLPNIKDVMYSLLLDAWSYDDAEDEYAFANEFGFDTIEDCEKVIKMYMACKKTSIAIHKMFTDAELETLEKETEIIPVSF